MQYKVLGPLEVVDDGGSVDLGTAKQRALLALLLLETGKVVSADRLADLLWNGDPPTQAMGTLQAYASKLRRVLEPDRPARAPSTVLVTVHPGYALRVDDDDIDARRFERLLAEGRAAAATDPHRAAALLDEALSLWRGTAALADLTGIDALKRETSRLEELRLSAAEDRIELEIALGRHEAAVADLERLVPQHPLRERLRSLLMLALHRSGRQGEALQVFNDAREHLADALGLDPGPALRRLEEELRAGRDTTPAPAAVKERPAPETEIGGPAVPALVGRAREMAALEEALTAATRGTTRVVVVDGEPGVGKTRLVEAVAERAAAPPHGALVSWGRCLDGDDAPSFWPWREVVRGVVGALDDADLRSIVDARVAPVLQLVPELAARVDDVAVPLALGGEADRFRMYDAVVTLLARVADRRPVVVVIDDVQAADTPSLHLLRYIASSPPDAPILVLGTRRAGEGDDEVQATLAELARQPAASRLPLHGLDDAAAAELVASVAGTEPEPGMVRDVVDRASGNPFFLGELVRLHRDERGFSGQTLVPAGVRDVLRRRLLKLDRAVVDTLTAAAVIGPAFDLDLLETIAGGDALDHLEEGVRAGVVTELSDPVGRYRFSHALVQETLYDELTAVRRAQLHARIAAALDPGGPVDDGAVAGLDDERLTDLARHAAAGASLGDATRAADLALAAGNRALAQLGYEEARQHYHRGLLAVAAAHRIDERRRGNLLVALAIALRAEGDFAGARASALEAADIGIAEGDAELLAGAALALALPGAAIGVDFGRLDEVRVALLERALEELPENDSQLRLRVLTHLALAMYLSDDQERRREIGLEAMAMAERLGFAGAVVAGLAARHSTLWGPGTVEERIDIARRMIVAAEEGGAGQTALESRIVLGVDLLEQGDIDGFDEAVARLDELTDRIGQGLYRWFGLALAAGRATMRGDYGEAERLSVAALEAGRSGLRRRAQNGWLIWRVVHGLDRGDLDELIDVLRGLVHRIPGTGSAEAGLALCAAETGETAEARAMLERLVTPEGLRLVRADLSWHFVLAMLTEVAAALDDRIRAGILYDALLPSAGLVVVAGAGDGCMGAVDRSLGVLATVLGRWDDAERHFADALAVNERLGAVPWVGRTHLDRAPMLQRRGKPGDEEAAAADRGAGQEIAERIGAPGLLARA